MKYVVYKRQIDCGTSILVMIAYSKHTAVRCCQNEQGLLGTAFFNPVGRYDTITATVRGLVSSCLS
jgi:hypothetical protein